MQPYKAKGNWFDGLIVAINHFQNEMGSVKFINKQIILITNFEAASHVEEEEIEKVCIITLHRFKLCKGYIFLQHHFRIKRVLDSVFVYFRC